MDIKAIDIRTRSLSESDGEQGIAIMIHAFDDAQHLQRAAFGNPAKGLATTLVVKAVDEIGESITAALRELLNR